MPKPALQVGQETWVYARIFDTQDEPWSTNEFGANGPSKMLLGKVIREFSATMWTIRFYYDSTDMEVPKRLAHRMTQNYTTVDGKIVRKTTRAERRALENLESEESEETEQSSDEDGEVDDDNLPLPEWEEKTITSDPRSRYSSERKTRLRSEILSHDYRSVETSLVWQLFTRFCPISFLEVDTLDATNNAAADDAMWVKPLTIGELLIFLGLVCLMMCISVAGDRRNYWKKAAGRQWGLMDDLVPSPDFGRFMTRQRFELICKYLTPGDNGQPQDKLRYYRDWIDAVLRMFRTAVRPGRDLVLDETMIENQNMDKADCITYIPRKPCPAGHQFWTVVTADAGILVNYELNEGKEVTREREFCSLFGATCATTLRLMRPYFNTFRCVFIDSWFQSVRTACQLKIRGMDSIGIVKTAHKGYPKEKLEEMCPAVAGALATLSAIIACQAVGVFTLMAGQWRTSRHHKLTLLSTASSYAPSPTPYLSGPNRREVPAPVIVLLWYLNFGKVDAFNHTMVAGGSNGWEHMLRLKSKRNFPLFTGLMSMIDANIFIAMKYFFPDENKDLTHAGMRRMLATALINNPLRIPEDAPDYVEDVPDRACTHEQEFLDSYSNCYICFHTGRGRKGTKLQCKKCDVRLCRDSAERQCWTEHLVNGLPPKSKKRKAADAGGIIE